MIQAFKRLSELVPKQTTLVVGGGGAMLLAYDFPLATADIDAVPKGISIEEMDPLVKQIAMELEMPGDWLNPYFSSFTHVLSPDFQERLVVVFREKKLLVNALGKEDLLLMKCFAHRRKDIPHARALIRKNANTELVYSQIEHLKGKKIPQSQEAMDFLDEVIDLET